MSTRAQGYAKFYTFLWHRDNILNLKNQNEKFHEHFSSGKLSRIFEEKFMIVAHVCAGLTILYTCTFILLAFYPILYYLLTNEKMLISGIELPLIDWKYSWIGYGINFFHQFSSLSSFFYISLFSLCIIICFITIGFCQFDVLRILLDELNELIINNQDGSNDDEISQKIKFLAKTHANLIAYLQELRKTFAPYYFHEFVALVFQKTVELFAIITVSSIFKAENYLEFFNPFLYYSLTSFLVIYVRFLLDFKYSYHAFSVLS